MSDVRTHVKQLVSEVLSMPASEIDENEVLTNYGLSSIDLLDVVVKLEEKYRIHFDPNTMRNVTCRLLADNIESLLATAR